MLVSHGPSKNFPHGEEKGTMGLLIILLCRECILEDLAHEIRAFSTIVRKLQIQDCQGIKQLDPHIQGFR
jgi:hypothetical protein